jgi:hypothetical protein
MRGPWPKGVGFYGLLGAVLVVVGGFLPWVSGSGTTLTAWNISLLSIAVGGDVGGPPIGLLLLAPLLVLLPYVIRRPLPLVVRLLLVGIATNTAGAILVTVLRHSPPMSMGIGLILTLAGAVLLALGEAGAQRSQEAT